MGLQAQIHTFTTMQLRIFCTLNSPLLSHPLIHFMFFCLCWSRRSLVLMKLICTLQVEEHASVTSEIYATTNGLPNRMENPETLKQHKLIPEWYLNRIELPYFNDMNLICSGWWHCFCSGFSTTASPVGNTPITDKFLNFKCLNWNPTLKNYLYSSLLIIYTVILKTE